MALNRHGEIVNSVWKEIPLHYPRVKTDVFNIMPNHIHGILNIQRPGRADPRSAPTNQHPLSEIVRAFKAYSTRKINELRQLQGAKVWQRGYYEHVIRSEEEFSRIGEYILFNAAKWETDRENPQCSTTVSNLLFEF